jgi:hypothetical protein
MRVTTCKQWSSRIHNCNTKELDGLHEKLGTKNTKTNAMLAAAAAVLARQATGTQAIDLTARLQQYFVSS